MARKGGAAIVLGFGIGAAILAMGGGRARARAPVTGASCGDSPTRARTYRTDRALRAWVNCPGRRAEDVAQLAAGLDTDRRSREATLVRDVWNRRRQIEDAPATGAVEPETRAAVERAVTDPTPPRDVPPDPAEAASAGGASAPATSGGPRHFDPSESRTYDPARARQLAQQLYRYLRANRTGRLDVERLIPFQEAAGLATDGLYGGMTANALAYYGIQNPPMPRVPPSREDPAAVYAPSSPRSIFREP